jgi:hypothetical protein
MKPETLALLHLIPLMNWLPGTNPLLKLHAPIACTLAFAFLNALTVAAPVVDWHTFRDTTATTLSGQGTDDPVIGDFISTANQGFAIGYLTSPFSLVNVGDQITFTFGVRFNDALGTTGNGDNFRFALFDLNGQTPVTVENSATAGLDGQTDNFRGYIFGHKGGGGAGANGSMRERTAALLAGDNAFAVTGANVPTAPSLGTVGGDPVTLVSSLDGSGPLYSGVMTLTLTSFGVDVSGSFSGNGSSNLFFASDNTTPTPMTFGAVGFLFGGGISVDQAIFTDVTVVPEPATCSLLALGGALLLRRRRSNQKNGVNPPGVRKSPGFWCLKEIARP